MSATGDADGRLPFRVRAGWAVGTFVTTSLLFLTSTFFLRFMTDYVGIAAALAGTLLASTKLVDAFLNPLVGVASDRARTPAGRRRPFLLAGALLGGATLVLQFSVPAALQGLAQVAYVFATLVLVSLSYVSFNVPYLAMLAEMTPSPDERAVLVSFRVHALAAAQFIAGGLSPLLIDAFGGGRAGFTGMAMVMGGVIVAAGVTCFVATRPAPRTTLTEVARDRFWSSLPTLFQSRLYVALVLVKATFLVGSTAHTVTATYYVRYVMQAPNAVLSAFLLVYSIGMIASQVAWLAACRRIGKVRAFLGASAVYATVSVLWAALGADAPTWLFIVLSFVNGAGAGGLLLCSESLLPDAIDDDCRRSGTRREGTLAALFAFTEKAANALGVALVGFVLAWFQYRAPPAGQAIPPNVVRAIMACFGLVPAFFVGISGLWWVLARGARPAPGPAAR
ncbi:MAG: MFS transporter [Steroidobacteraceae bacterium]|jgi:GPH family glycoside/pentoside/hexuronide:cation symporter|nr:MFS transporter [Steroidobacteraceae bacterium]